MSRQPIAHNADLSRLEDEGYALEIDSQGYLLVRNVPYVTPAREIKRGIIVGTLKTGGTVEDIIGFQDHSVRFAGEMPCDHAGTPLTKLVIGSGSQDLAHGIRVDHHFSQKPASGAYPSIYAQVKQYITIDAT